MLLIEAAHSVVPVVRLHVARHSTFPPLASCAREAYRWPRYLCSNTCFIPSARLVSIVLPSLRGCSNVAAIFACDAACRQAAILPASGLGRAGSPQVFGSSDIRDAVNEDACPLMCNRRENNTIRCKAAMCDELQHLQEQCLCSAAWYWIEQRQYYQPADTTHPTAWSKTARVYVRNNNYTLFAQGLL